MLQFQFRSIVVPIDFSPDADAALKLTLASTNDANEIRAVHVLADLPLGEPGYMWEEVNFETRADNVRREFAQRYPGEAYRRVTFDVVEGDPGSQIAEYAQKVGADLIVMSSHGRSGLKRLFLGSVAERTMRLAHCAVLVLRS